jgi:hypothetical protein
MIYLGIKLLLELINDEDDDELSKKAFGTLEDLDTAAVDGLVHLMKKDIEQLNLISKSRLSLNISHSSDRKILICELEKSISIQPISSPQKIQEIEIFNELEKLLPILNGLVYMNKSKKRLLFFIYTGVSQYTLEQFGLKPILKLFETSIPLEIINHSLYLLSNLTIEKNSSIQNMVI